MLWFGLPPASFCKQAQCLPLIRCQNLSLIMSSVVLCTPLLPGPCTKNPILGYCPACQIGVHKMSECRSATLCTGCACMRLSPSQFGGPDAALRMHVTQHHLLHHRNTFQRVRRRTRCLPDIVDVQRARINVRTPAAPAAAVLGRI